MSLWKSGEGRTKKTGRGKVGQERRARGGVSGDGE